MPAAQLRIGAAWEIDRDGELRSLIQEKYEYVGSPCGRKVYLRRGESRDLADEATCSPGPGWSVVPDVGQLYGQAVESQT